MELTWFPLQGKIPTRMQEILDTHAAIDEWIIEGHVSRKRIHWLAKQFPRLEKIIYTPKLEQQDEQEGCSE
jgi:hypothetical protein